MATAALSPVTRTAEGAPAITRRWPEYLVLCLFAALICAAVPYHEPWVDEAQAWQIARTLPLREILPALRYEGHPLLWYALLRGMIHLHVSYTGMRWIAAWIAFGGVALLVLRSPFPRWVRLLLPFTFFLGYQWAIVARSYVLVPLLAFAAAAVWKRKSALPVALTLGVLANVALHAWMLAFGLAVVYAAEIRRVQKPRHLAWAAGIFSVLAAAALYTALPPPPDTLMLNIMAGWGLGFRIVGFFYKELTYLGTAGSPWFFFSIPFVLLSAHLLARMAGRVYLLPLALVVVFSGLHHQFWHGGFAVVAVITTAWIGWRPQPPAVQQTARAATLIWLALQVCSFAFAFTWDHRHAYSPDRDAAAYLAPLVATSQPLAVTTGMEITVGAFQSVGLAPYFPRPIFLNEPKGYWVWSIHQHTAAQFDQALATHPAAIVALFHQDRGGHFTPGDFQTPQIARLNRAGYQITRTFCGQKPEYMSVHEDTCEVILEPARLAGSANHGESTSSPRVVYTTQPLPPRM